MGGRCPGHCHWGLLAGAGKPFVRNFYRDSVAGLKAGQNTRLSSHEILRGQAVAVTSRPNPHSQEGRAWVKMLVKRMEWKRKPWKGWTSWEAGLGG